MRAKSSKQRCPALCKLATADLPDYKLLSDCVLGTALYHNIKLIDEVPR